MAKTAALMAGRYAQAKLYKRTDKQLKSLRTRLVRMIRNIRRKTAGNETLQTLFSVPLIKARQIREQKLGQRGW